VRTSVGSGEKCIPGANFCQRKNCVSVPAICIWLQESQLQIDPRILTRKRCLKLDACSAPGCQQVEKLTAGMTQVNELAALSESQSLTE
jgi:hypothetical protein